MFSLFRQNTTKVDELNAVISGLQEKNRQLLKEIDDLTFDIEALQPDGSYERQNHRHGARLCGWFNRQHATPLYGAYLTAFTTNPDPGTPFCRVRVFPENVKLFDVYGETTSDAVRKAYRIVLLLKEALAGTDTYVVVNSSPAISGRTADVSERGKP